MKKFRTLLVAILALLIALAFVGCKPDAPMLKFEENGGGTISNIKFEDGKEYTLTAPTREGYEFQGWYTSKDFSGEKVEKITAGNKSVTVYAKWAKLYNINVEIAGGTLATTNIQATAGTNVFSLMQAHIPTKADHQFGQWMVDGAALTTSYKMPENDITLTAQYKVKYVVEYYLKDIGANTYTKDAKDKVAYDYAGKTIAETAATLTGFNYDSTNAGNVLSVVLSETISNNILKFYYNRKEFKITYKMTYPDGATENDVEVTGEYGQQFDTPSNYEADGYYFAGWTPTEGDGVAYFKSNYISSKLQNATGESELNKVTIESNATLYPVWEKAYTDMFGGSDYIYVDEEAGEVYLCRQGYYFVGDYDKDTKEFFFRNKDGDIINKGKIINQTNYAYNDADRNGTAYYMYVCGQGVLDNQIYFDAFNGLTYSERQEDGTTIESDGTYYINEAGRYVATFTEGKLKGQKLEFVLANAGVGVFIVYNEVAAEIGTLVRCVMMSQGLSYYYTLYSITMDGLFTATFVNADGSSSNFEYTYDDKEQTVTLYSQGQPAMVGKIIDLSNGVKGYMLYTPELDNTFTSTDGKTLTLDGMGTNAEYNDGTRTYKGTYTASSSAIDGSTLITFTATGANFVLGLKANEDKNGNVTYVLEEKPQGYAEYYFTTETNQYITPYLTVNDTAVGNATLYAMDEATSTQQKRVLVKVSTGKVEDKGNGTYVYTAENFFELESAMIVENIDPNLIKSFVFGVDNQVLQVPGFFFYSMTDTFGATTAYVDADAIYTCNDGKNEYTLTFVAGIAIYQMQGEEPLYISYQEVQGITILVMPGQNGVMYVELDKENNTFIHLTESPYNIYKLNVDGSGTDKFYIFLNGKGDAIYTTVTVDEEGEPVLDEDGNQILTEVVGKIEDTEKTTVFGDALQKFVANDGTLTFEFLLLTGGSNRYYALYNENYNGTYTSANGETIQIDGYGFTYEFTDAEGKKTKGVYAIDEENNTINLISGVNHVLDLGANKTFSIRGFEAGSYLLYDNNYIDGTIIELDGYGHAKLYTFEVDENGEAVTDEDGNNVKVDIDANATYTKTEDGVFTLSYTVAGSQKTKIGTLGTYAMGGSAYYVFIVTHEEFAFTYLNGDDWSVMVVDSIGNAVRYGKDGKSDAGMFEIITDNLMYFYRVNQKNDGEDACLYNIDRNTGKISLIELSNRGYYTSNFETLLFDYSGVAVFGGETQYYYTVDETGAVVLYYRDLKNANANAYGYVVDNTFGKLEDTVTYGGETYYVNDGFALRFDRAAATADKYPVPVNQDENGNMIYGKLGDISFSPVGNGTFRVMADAYIDGTSYTGVMERKLNEDGTYSMTLIVNPFTFGISVNFNGASDCTYEIVSMVVTNTYYSYDYLTDPTLLLVMQMFGLPIEDLYGTITKTVYYAEDGTPASKSLTTNFLELSNMKDSQGNIIELKDVDYVEEGGWTIVEFTGKDGIKYEMRFTLVQTQLGTGYAVALSRVEELTSGEYTLKLLPIVGGTSLFNEYKYIYTKLSKGEKVLGAEENYSYNGKLIYVERTKSADGKTGTAEYYEVTVTEEEGKYTAFSVVAKTGIKTIYSGDGVSFVDFDAEDKPIMIFVNRRGVYIVDQSKLTYDATAGTWTFNASETEDIVITITEENGVKSISIKFNYKTAA